jgi:hypothetical protein
VVSLPPVLQSKHRGAAARAHVDRVPNRANVFYTPPVAASRICPCFVCVFGPSDMGIDSDQISSAPQAAGCMHLAGLATLHASAPQASHQHIA